MTATSNETVIPGYLAGTWTIDPVHSEVGFSVRHMMVSKVRGRFTSFSGTITTGATPQESGAEAAIELASISTGSEQRDAHLRSPDFFHTDANPLMTFRSTEVRPKGDRWEVVGELSLNGVTKTVVLDTEVVGIAPDAYGGTRAGLSASTTINRQDFKVTWNAAIEGGGVVVSDKVDIRLDIEAVLQA